MKHKTMREPSARLLATLHRDNKEFFILSEAVKILSASNPDAVRKLISNMVKRGLLFRIKDGLYSIIPHDKDADAYQPNRHGAAKYLTQGAAYYIGYYSAMQIHSLITQPALREQIAVNEQMRPGILRVKDVEFQFIYHNKEHFFGYKNIWVDSYNKAPCSDLEKTFIDGLFKPDYAGGIAEIAKAIFKSRDKIDYKKLYEYSKKFNSQAVIKRLGFLLELLEINHPIIEKLNRLKTHSFILLEPSYKKEGKRQSRWSIQQNMDTNSIREPLYA